MKLENKIAIITGGSRGIGYATAEKFIEEGATVILCASRQQTAENAFEDLKAKYPNASIDYMWPDLGKYDDVEKAFNKVKEKYGAIDILVNNAGIADATPFTEYTEELFDKIMNLNVKGVFNGSLAVSKIMIEQKHGVILNTASMVSRYGQSTGVAYPTSKAAVKIMTVSLARELGKYGIRVNAVAPGVIETDMMKAVPEEMIKPLISRIPLGQLGKPEDVANAFAFLASDEASYISGVTLGVDGMAMS